jgi:hypothetical protein
MSLALGWLAIVLVAHASGASDSFKGVATLCGDGAASHRRGLTRGTLTRLAGPFAAVLFSDRLLRSLTGAGLVADAPVGAPTVVASGSAAVGLLATCLSLPVSTTCAGRSPPLPTAGPLSAFVARMGNGRAT